MPSKQTSMILMEGIQQGNVANTSRTREARTVLNRLFTAAAHVRKPLAGGSRASLGNRHCARAGGRFRIRLHAISPQCGDLLYILCSEPSEQHR
jgi:hypothetical protein